MNLKHIKPGEMAVIRGFASDKLATRLIAMGLASGSKVIVIRKALFGNAFYVRSGNLRIGLRSEEAESILVSYE